MVSKRGGITNIILSPKSAYLQLINNTLAETVNSDLENNSKKFCRGVKNLNRLMKPYFSEQIIEQLDSMLREHDEVIKEIKKGTTGEVQRKTAVLESDYEFYSGVFMYGLDAFTNSALFEKDVKGVLMYSNMRDIKALAKMVRKPIDIELTGNKLKEGKVFGGLDDEPRAD